MHNPEITICSVSHARESCRELQANYDLTAALNSSTPFAWFVADNALRAEDAFGDGRFEVFDGAGSETWGFETGWGSRRHATALNKLFPRARTRFLLALDPDFYIVRRDWIREVVAHMQNHNLAFFGSTWHPRYYAKYRYFPTVHCLFVDLEKVSAAELDVMPGPVDKKQGKPRRAKFPGWLQRPLLALTLQDRKFIGDSRDTGWTMYERFFQRTDLRRECLQAAYRPWRDLRFPQNILYWPNRLVEAFLPDRLCFIPQKRGYYSTVGFRELGYSDIRHAVSGWEEYLWHGRPFAFHLRGSKLGYQGDHKGARFADDFAFAMEAMRSFAPSLAFSFV